MPIMEAWRRKAPATVVIRHPRAGARRDRRADEGWDMRELRTFELDEPGQPVSWRACYGQTVCAMAGKLWVTVEGNPDDIWLEPGAEMALPEGYRVWLSGD